jgi:hypothetical protein
MELALADDAAAPAAAARLAQAARSLATWADSIAAPAPVQEVREVRQVREPVTAPEPPPISTRDETSKPPRAARPPAAGPIEARPQGLSRRRAQQIADAAELIRDPDYRDTRRSTLRSGETVLGYVGYR